MRVAFLVALFAALAGSALAGSYQVVYQEQIEGAENISDIDPILSEDREILGYTSADSVAWGVYIHWLYRPLLVVPFDLLSYGRWLRTDNYFSGDTLFLYAVRAPYFITRSTIVADSVCTTTLEIGRSFTYGQPAQIEIGLHLERSEGQPVAVVHNRSERWEAYSYTMGIDSGITSFDVRYNLDLTGMDTKWITKRLYGDLADTEGIERISFNNYFSYRYYLSDDPEHPEPQYYDIEYLETSLRSATSTQLFYARTVYAARVVSVFVGRFSPYATHDEVLFYGVSPDLTLQHTTTSHVACYSFSSGTPEEIWYTPLSGVTLDYVYKPQHFIAGMCGSNKVIALNYWTGQLCDSVDLDRNLTATTFFETGSEPSILNLVGRNYDTVFVYQFQTPNDVRVEPALGLPSTFTLAQNYPNPFNNETLISFTNPVHQNLALVIYNVLGQRVRSLRDGETSPGEYSLPWDGRDDDKQPVASGVYFARLISPTDSRLIKLVLLK